MVSRGPRESQSYNLYEKITTRDTITTGFVVITWRRLLRTGMDINQLEVLVAVAQEKSFSRAAETLHRTQPAVSQAIRRLETELGEPLFDRSSKDGTLTAAGRVLFEFAQQMLNLRHGAHRAIKEL